MQPATRRFGLEELGLLLAFVSARVWCSHGLTLSHWP